ncbi:hypothetical protein B0T17DRAFT_482251 [Bombardia bombarda]|uniref:C2H2-type domain-containing protein n=1 Tax=Bombardia bombarda TaxID=252184 RepID=A0AA40CEB6_9PEZI|nr:hypothetical protein B0T17DRAFT_482251 [Bombardia bombarda]
MNGGAHQQHEDEDEDDDQNGLIQSDLIDQHKRKKQSKSFPPAVSPSSLRQVSTPSGTPEPRKRTAPDTTPSGATPRPQKRPSLPPWVPQIRSGNQPDPAGPSSHPPGAKKRGRSKGWRPGQRSYASARPFDPSAPPQDRPPKPKKSVGKLKRRGRPPRNPSPTPRQIYDSLKPRFVPFLCEWQGCPASLHNFETLRRHVLNVHGREKGILTCKWGKCRPAASPSTPVIEFETDEAFPAHVDKEHLIPLRWIMGDGPQNTSVNSDVPRGGPYAAMAGDADPLPRYLFSADGKKQITPSIKEFEYENDEDLKKRKRMVEKLLQKQQENAPEEPTYTQAEVEVIAAGLDETNAKKKMFEEYTARVCGTKTHGPVYGEEWRGTLVGGRKERR